MSAPVRRPPPPPQRSAAANIGIGIGIGLVLGILLVQFGIVPRFFGGGDDGSPGPTDVVAPATVAQDTVAEMAGTDTVGEPDGVLPVDSLPTPAVVTPALDGARPATTPDTAPGAAPPAAAPAVQPPTPTPPVVEDPIAVDGLPISRVVPYSEAGLSGYRVWQALSEGDTLELVALPLVDAATSTTPVVSPGADGATGYVAFAGMRVAGRAPIAPDSLRVLLARLAGGGN